MNLTEMRAVVRCDLHDEDAGSYRWTDDELDRHIAHAVAELSEAIPLEETALLATTAGSRDLDVSSLSGLIIVTAVEYPVGNYPRQYQRFSLWAGTLTLLCDGVPDGQDARIYYGKTHTLSAQSSTIPSHLSDLVAIGAEGYASLEWAGFAVNRVNVGGNGTPESFERLGQGRLDFFRKELARLGHRNRVRLSQLYRPAMSLVSKATDGGP